MRFYYENLKNTIDASIVVGITSAVLAAAIILLYLHFNYLKFDARVDSVYIILDKSSKTVTPLVYLVDSTKTTINFSNAYFFKSGEDGMYKADLGRGTRLRKVRIYFPDTISHLLIKGLGFMSGSKKFSLDFDRIENSKRLEIKGDSGRNLIVKTSAGNEFLETPWIYYPFDFPLLIPLSIGLVLLAFLFSFISHKYELFRVTSLSIANLSFFVLVFSLLLSRSFFNITLVISSLLVLRKFDLKYFLSNRINFLFILFFIIIGLSLLLASSEYSFRSMEKYVLFLYLPIFISCIRDNNSLGYIPISSIIIGLVLLLTSVIDISIFRNLDIASFTNFTRAIEPVYYSYFLSFSIFFVQLESASKYKYVAEGILFLLLILCGSKLIISITLILFSALFIRSYVGVLVLVLAMSTIFIFPPMQKRFKSILNVNDLSIVSEEYIENPDDPRINGLTFRIILWQASFASMDNWKKILIGNGMGKLSDEGLKMNLKKRGLTNHIDFNSHNQFVSTFYKTGIFGILLLLYIIIYVAWVAVRDKNVLLLTTICLMSFAMMSESIFERVIGISIFCIMTLLLSGSFVRKNSY